MILILENQIQAMARNHTKTEVVDIMTINISHGHTLLAQVEFLQFNTLLDCNVFVTGPHSSMCIINLWSLQQLIGKVL